MKNKIIIALMLALVACTNESNKVAQAPAKIPVYKNVTTVKVVKKLKEVTETHTDYDYKYDWVNGKLKQQPNVYTTTEYFVIYTDNTKDLVQKDQFILLDKGDTIKKVSRVISHYK